MGEKDSELKPFPVTFKDREVMFNPPSEGQIAVIARAGRKAQRGGGQNAVDAIGLILDVIDRLVVDPDDRNWLEEGLIDASIELDDFIGVLDGINQGGQEEEPKKAAAPARARAARR
jgi:hypothetical protein